MAKKYYIPCVDELNYPEETPASKARTERSRFVITTILASIAAGAAIIAAIFAALAYFG